MNVILSKTTLISRLFFSPPFINNEFVSSYLRLFRTNTLDKNWLLPRYDFFVAFDTEYKTTSPIYVMSFWKNIGSYSKWFVNQLFTYSSLWQWSQQVAYRDGNARPNYINSLLYSGILMIVPTEYFVGLLMALSIRVVAVLWHHSSDVTRHTSKNACISHSFVRRE